MINYNVPKPKFKKGESSIIWTRKIKDYLNKMMENATCMERYNYAKKHADKFLKRKP